MAATKNEAAELVDAYYASWERGIPSFDEGRLATILAEDLDFEGPIAARRRGAAGFIGGLRRFVGRPASRVESCTAGGRPPQERAGAAPGPACP